MDSKLSPTKVANLLTVSASTVRRLTGLYADYFSPDATPPAGGRRFYNAEDVETLRTIIDLQNTGVAEPDIIARLDRGVTLPSQPTDLVAEPVNPFSALPAPQIIKLDTQDVTASIERLAAAQDRQTATMERLISALIWFAAALVVIVLLTIAAAAGWL